MFHVHLRRRCILLHLDGMSWRYQWDPSHISFKTCVFLLIFCVDDLSIGVSGVLNIVNTLLLCYCQFLLSCLLVFVLCIEVLLCWVHRYLQLLCLPPGLSLLSIYVSCLISCNILYFKVSFVWYEDYYSISFPSHLHGIYFSILSLSVYICLQIWSGFLVDSICIGHVFVSIQPVCVFWLEHLIYLHLK